MTGEIKIQLKKYDQAVLTKIFDQEYHHKLSHAYAQSAYKDGKIFGTTRKRPSNSKNIPFTDM